MRAGSALWFIGEVRIYGVADGSEVSEHLECVNRGVDSIVWEGADGQFALVSRLENAIHKSTSQFL